MDTEQYNFKYSCFSYNFKEDVIHEEIEDNREDNREDREEKYKNIKNKKYNYKFVSRDFFVENELKISKLISRMINYKKYFYIPSKIEKINFVDINDENKNVEDFETEYDINLKYRKKISSNNILLKYDNIQILDLNDYLSSNNLFFNNLFSEKKYIFYKIIHVYEKLLKSINMLNQNFIFYNNLNFENENIFINQFETPMLSEFCFSINFKSKEITQDLQNIILKYEPSYIQWPVEIHAISYIFYNNLSTLSNHNIDKIVSEMISNNYIFDNFSENMKEKYYNDGISFLKKFVNKKTNEIISEIILYFKSWDNYALSILYLQIIIKIYKFVKNNKFIIDFMKLLLKNISFNPEKRFSLKNTKLEFNNIINHISISEFKEIVNSLNNLSNANV